MNYVLYRQGQLKYLPQLYIELMIDALFYDLSLWIIPLVFQEETSG